MCPGRIFPVHVRTTLHSQWGDALKSSREYQKSTTALSSSCLASRKNQFRKFGAVLLQACPHHHSEPLNTRTRQYCPLENPLIPNPELCVINHIHHSSISRPSNLSPALQDVFLCIRRLYPFSHHLKSPQLHHPWLRDSKLSQCSPTTGPEPGTMASQTIRRGLDSPEGPHWA